MDNPETLATTGTQEREQRQTKEKQHNTDEEHGPIKTRTIRFCFL